MYTTPNLGLRVWDSTDGFNPDDLEYNWLQVDADYARPRTADRVEILSVIPTTGNFDGRIVYLTDDDSGFKAKSVVRYNGATWRVVGPSPEVHAALPVTNNFAGRVVVLSTAGGGFAQWDAVINTDGANSWAKVGGLTASATLPGSPSAGQAVLLSAAVGGFEAYTLVVYNGAAWVRAEKRGVEVVATLPTPNHAGQLVVVNQATGGFDAWDVVRWNGVSWERVDKYGVRSGTALPSSPTEGQMFVLTAGAGAFSAGDVVRYYGGAWSRVNSWNPSIVGVTDGDGSGWQWPSANAAILVPFVLNNPGTISGVWVNINLGAGNLDAGIYSYAGTLANSSGSTASPGSGAQQLTFGATTLATGRYWLALAASSTGLEVRSSSKGLSQVAMRQVASSFPLPSTIVPGSTRPGRGLVLAAEVS